MAPPVARTTARMNGKWQTAQSDVPAPTFGDYGKQAVNSLAFQADFLSSWGWLAALGGTGHAAAFSRR
jgi:hypothetical protein